MSPVKRLARRAQYGLLAVLLASAGLLHAQNASPGEARALSASEREAIEAVVRDYLLKNPKLLRDVEQVLAKQEADERDQQQRAALAANRDALYNDPKA